MAEALACAVWPSSGEHCGEDGEGGKGRIDVSAHPTSVATHRASMGLPQTRLRQNPYTVRARGVSDPAIMDAMNMLHRGGVVLGGTEVVGVAETTETTETMGLTGVAEVGGGVLTLERHDGGGRGGGRWHHQQGAPAAPASLPHMNTPLSMPPVVSGREESGRGTARGVAALFNCAIS